MVTAFLRVLAACLLAGLTLLLASPLIRAADAPPADPPPSAVEPAPADTGGGAAGAADTTEDPPAADADKDGSAAAEAPPVEEQHLPEGVLRRRPQTAEQERIWKETKAPQDPFLFTPGPLGPAPGVPEFYNPQDFVDPQVCYGLSRYLIQDASGQVVGYLSLAVTREVHPEFGETVAASLYYDDDKPCELKLWLDPLTLQPHRLNRQQRLVPGAADAQAAAGTAENTTSSREDVEIAALQRVPQDRVDYVFDAVRLWHASGGITVSRSLRQLPYSYELAALPVLVRQVRPYGQVWPFEAALIDGLKLRNLPMLLAQPTMADVLSAEPATHQCYELRITAGDEEQVYWVERSLPRRLIKFQAGGRTYNLFEYTESK
jgi:hypothetical protein